MTTPTRDASNLTEHQIRAETQVLTTNQKLTVTQELTATQIGNAAGTPAAFNPFAPAFRRDPYPIYQRLREAAPVHRTLGMWVLTRYADVHRVLRDRTVSAELIPRLVSRQANRVSRSPRVESDVDRITRLGRASLVFTDNPAHARLRGLVNRVFTASEIAGLRPIVVDTAQGLLRRAWDDGGMDVIADLAAPLPVTVLCREMALPEELHGQVGPWTHDIRALLEPGMLRAEDFDRVGVAVEAFAAALQKVVDDRRRRPGEDLISRLLAVETAGGDRLGDEELVFVCIMCFVAGNETTKALLGNAILALLRHPDQAELLRRDPALVRKAVTEALRYDSPLQLTKRLATRDMEIGGHVVPAGGQLLLCLGAANRDPAVFDRPDTFDLTRDIGAKSHLAFGHGMHGCLGGPLAELQAEVVLDLLHRRPERLAASDLTDDALVWQDASVIVRGLARLPVTVVAE